MRHRATGPLLALLLLAAASPATAQPQRVHGSFAPPRTPADRGATPPALWLATAEGFRGWEIEHLIAQETLGGVPAYHLVASTDDAALRASDLVGQLVTFGVRLGPNQFRVRSAFVIGASQMPGRPRPDGTRPNTFQLELAPWLAALGRTNHYRVFEGARAVDVLRAVFDRYDFARVDYRVRGTPPRLDRVAQYGESDLAFAHRVLARAGLHYYFEHGLHGHTLVVTDGAEPRRRRRRPLTLVHEAEDPLRAVHAFRRHHRIEPTRFRGTVQDANGARRVVEARAGEPTALGELVVSGRLPADGEGVAERQARALLRRSRFSGVFSMMTENRQLEVGSAFRLRGHPAPGVDDLYRVVGTSWTASPDRGPQPAISFSGDYQLQRLDERFYLAPESGPAIDGPQVATVVGPRQGAVHTDAEGRVRVRLPWPADAGEAPPEAWVPVVGGGEWRPAVGARVLVHFLDGSPARPVLWVPSAGGPSR
jgi:type VI secretion system secreted protein VgrG